MRIGRLIMAVFCLASTISGPQSFAVGTDAQQIKKNKVVALLRLENNEVKCVNYTKQSYAQNSRLQIPLCQNEGLIGEQNQAAANIALAGGERTAWVTHAGMVLAGCLYGAAGAMAGMSIGSINDGKGTAADAAEGSIVAGMIGSIGAGMMADPSGHLIAGWSGLLLCGGGITYMIYSEQSRKK